MAISERKCRKSLASLRDIPVLGRLCAETYFDLHWVKVFAVFQVSGRPFLGLPRRFSRICSPKIMSSQPVAYNIETFEPAERFKPSKACRPRLNEARASQTLSDAAQLVRECLLSGLERTR
jgi:hypothetical protein